MGMFQAITFALLSTPSPYKCGEYAEPGVPHCRRRLLDADQYDAHDPHDPHLRSSSHAAPCVGAAVPSPTCLAGMRQSPINIRSRTTVPIDSDELNLEMHYADSIPVEYEAPHKKWDVEPWSRDSHVMAKGQRWNLIQFHMHSPSEHQFDGKVYPAELHFVHQNPVTKQLLVFGLLFGHDGGNNSAIFLDELASPTSIAKGELDLTLGSLPEVRTMQNWSYYHYMGSLTAGSCAEDVIWAVSTYIAPSNEMVVCNHVGVSGIFSTARPVLLLNERVIKHSSWAKPAKLGTTGPTVAPPSASSASMYNMIIAVALSGAVGVAMLAALGIVVVVYRHKTAVRLDKLLVDAAMIADMEWHDAQVELRHDAQLEGKEAQPEVKDFKDMREGMVPALL